MGRTRARRRGTRDEIIRARCASIFAAQRRRARKYHTSLSYTADDLFKLVMSTPCCKYCHEPLRPRDFQLDHQQPVSRGGHFSLENLVPVCARDNRAKHSLTDEEFSKLLKVLSGLNDYTIRNVMARLRAGAGWLTARIGE